MKTSVKTALFLLLILTSYFLVRSIMRDDAPKEAVSTAALTVQSTEQTSVLPEILFTETTTELHPIFLSLKGRTAPNRTVTVKAATTGTVMATPVDEGARVRRGRTLCRLDVDARQARIAEAEAMLKSRQVDYDAAEELARKGWASQTRAASAKASLDAATAELNSARIELSRTDIIAPFDGIFEERRAEIGDFLAQGGACGVVTDFNPIKVQTDVTEAHALRLTVGSAVTVDIAGLPQQVGEISYISKTAEENTRTFRMLALVNNDDRRISAGLTSNLRVQIGEAMSTPISPALLTLHDDGRTGVRFLNDDDRVEFVEVNIVDDDGDNIWVTGLPDGTRLIIVGQEFVKEGTLADPVNISQTSRL
ncbi:MAG: efflux RND transporter periplasmic adaptor subunit [Pseudomonadota bacterium]